MESAENVWKSWHRHLLVATRIEVFSYYIVLPTFTARAENVLPARRPRRLLARL